MPTEIGRAFRFEMGHALTQSGGPSDRVHGHSYSGYVYVTGTVGTSTGMVMDYHHLADILKDVVNRFDHHTYVGANHHLAECWGDVSVVPWEPTTENLADFIGRLVIAELPNGVRLTRVILNETPNNRAIWRPDGGQL